MSTPPVVVETADQHRLLDDLLAATAQRRPVAVLDPTWPKALRESAHAAVRAAGGDGRLRAGDLALFTSGSTGRPRGVVRTLASWDASLDAVGEVTGVGEADTVWLPGPLWSSLFLYGAFHATAVGARVVTRDEPCGDATAVHCVPAQLPDLLDRAASGDLPALRTVVVAGDRLAADLRARCAARGWRVVEYYGAAELSFVAWREGDGAFAAFPQVQVEVREGRIWCRSPYLCRAYLDPADDGPLHRDAAGWASVGDLGEPDGAGLRVFGRGDAAVGTGGHTVVAAEVEQVLRAVPGVRDVAVVGLPHPRFGQLLTAVVVGAADDRALRAAAASLPAPARPNRFLHVADLPRTSGGKVARRAVVELATTLIGT